MAEPPASEGRTSGALVPDAAPRHERRRGTGGRVHGPEGTGDGIEIVREVVALGVAEAENLADQGDGDRAADVYARLALVAGETGVDADRLIESAEAHPLAPKLIMARAVTRSTAEELESAQSAIDSLVREPDERAGMMVSVAESWLFRLGEPSRAAQAARLASIGAGAPAPATALGEILRLALAAAQEWQELATLLGDDAASGDLEALAEAAHVLFDRVGDASATAAMLARESSPESLEAAGEPRVDRCILYLTGLARDVAGALGKDAPADGWLDAKAGLRRRVAIFASDSEASRDAAAARFALALRLAEGGELEEAGELMASLATGTDGQPHDWGPRAALQARAELASRRGAYGEAVEAHVALAEDAAATSAFAHLVRAAEIAEACAGDDARARALWEQAVAVSPDLPRVRRALQRAYLLADPEALVAHLSQLAEVDPDVAPFALRWASAVAETRLGDVDRAAEFRAACIGAAEAAGHLDVARLYALRGQVSAAGRAYAAAAENLSDERERAALTCSAGTLLLAGGEIAAARELLAQVAAADPGDVVARAALRGIDRRGERFAELADTLEQLAELASAEETRAAVLRELAEVSAARLGDRVRARAALDRVLEREPEDFPSLVALGRLCSELRDWPGAVDARQRAVEVVSDPAEAVALLMEIGDIEENRRGDEEAARVAYERAYELDETSLEALRAAARIHRRRKQYGELLTLLRAELPLTSEPPRLFAIHIEIARLAVEIGEGSDSALAAYREALALDPSNDTALAGVLRIARAEERFDIIPDAYRGAPRTAENLRVLADAYEKLGRYAELATTREAEIELASTEAKRADIARRLASVYEHQLGDRSKAADAYKTLVDNDPNDASAPRELARLLRETERWGELEAVYEQDLARIPAEDAPRQINVLLELGALRRDRLGKPVDAAAAYEAVLEREPGHVGALESLESLYRELDRDKDLARILEARAEVSGDRSQRAGLFAKSAELAAARGDVREAVAGYRRAFDADPTNADVFYVLEALCYRHERWSDIELLYRAAIDAVEQGRSESLSLADVLSRLGRLQSEHLGDPGAATATYARGLELDPAGDDAIANLESLCAAAGAWRELIDHYERRASWAGDAGVKVASLRRAAGLAATELGDEAETARLYERLLEVDPADDEALTALESHYEHAADWSALVEVLLKRLAPMPAGEPAAALLMRIAKLCEESLRDENRAIEFYRRILDSSPGNSDALDALARIYESTERWADFIEVTRKQIRITTDRNAKALLYFKCGSVMEAKFDKEDDAIRYYDAAIKTSPSCLPAVHGLRDLHRRREDWPRVIQTLELEVKLWQDDKERAGVFAQIGRIYADHLDDPDRALHYYESALAVDPDCVPANRALFDQYFATGAWELAQPLAQTLAQKAMREGSPSERSEFYRKYGVVARMTGDLRAAAESLVIALEIQPDNLEALDDLGELVKDDPQAYDYGTTFRELDKIYRKREGADALLARVMVTQAVLREREGDLDAAEELYREATERAPGDFAILSSLVDLHVAMRRWTHAVDAVVKFLESEPQPPLESRVAAMLRRGEIHADGEMDPHRAIGVFREVAKLLKPSEAQPEGELDPEIARLDPYRQEAYYRLAQEAFLLGRYDEARGAIHSAIEVAAAPGRELSPETLARYYFYLGRIAEARGEGRAAPAQFRRAAEYDPSYSAPALALARRSAESGDRAGAESLLINAAHEAMQHGGAAQAVPLQRGLGQILLMGGDRAAAIEAYRGILAVEPDEAADRLALAEIYAVEDLPKSIAEVKKILDRDLRFGPAYRQLAAFYSRAGDAEPAVRALSVMETLGFAEESDRGAAAKARAMQPPAPLRHPLTDELRSSLLMPEEALGAVGALFSAVSEPLSGLFPQPPMGEAVAPLSQGEDPAFDAAVADVSRLFGVQPEIFVGDRVPGGSVALAHPRPVVVVDREVLSRPDAERRFVLGRAFDSVRGEYAFLLGLGARQREELEAFLRSLVLRPEERAAPTNEFVSSLPPSAASAVEAVSSSQLDVGAWLEGIVALSRRAGLVACDDFNAATHAIARLNGEALPVGEESTMALGMVVCGADLVRYYLSDAYDQLRSTLTSALPVPAPQA